jgi:hypothetical protein
MDDSRHILKVGCVRDTMPLMAVEKVNRRPPGLVRVLKTKMWY